MPVCRNHFNCCHHVSIETETPEDFEQNTERPRKEAPEYLSVKLVHMQTQRSSQEALHFFKGNPALGRSFLVCGKDASQMKNCSEKMASFLNTYCVLCFIRKAAI